MRWSCSREQSEEIAFDEVLFVSQQLLNPLGGKNLEQSFVAWAKMRAYRLPQAKLGIGDDAAVLANVGRDTVVTTDTMMDGVHFESGSVDARRIGRKLVAANLSDLAAMAARPVAILLSMCIPITDDPASDELLAAEIYEGVCQSAEQHRVAIVGGDTNCWSGPLVLSLTAVGEVVEGEIWTRSGAKPGDLVVVTGALGGSILGKHLDFTPRLEWVEQVRSRVQVDAAMDISDGLSVDLLRMCDASHCGAVLDLDTIPVAAAAIELSQNSGKSPLEHALGDGEDFELLIALPQDELAGLQAIVGSDKAIACGTFTSRTGLWAREGARIRQMAATGYIHGQ
ncbi:MAG: thiamine-monophosphate kinase [Planctomycetales bacterium]|nr:thiamine-monophosphate kinase [Planctomycetales bacterium]